MDQSKSTKAQKLKRMAESSISVLPKPPQMDPDQTFSGLVISDATIDQLKAALPNLMDDYAIACIEEGLPLDDWRRKVNEILSADQGLAGQIYSDFCNYSSKADTDPSPAVTLARLRLKIDNALEVLGRSEDIRKAILAQLDMNDEVFKEYIVDELEVLSQYAQMNGSFKEDWSRSVAMLLERDPALAFEATRFSINPVSKCSPQALEDMNYACRFAFKVAHALIEKQSFPEGAKLFNYLQIRAKEGFEFYGTETVRMLNGLSVTLSQQWESAVKEIPGSKERSVAQAALDSFKGDAMHNDQGREDKKPGDEPSSPRGPDGPV